MLVKNVSCYCNVSINIVKCRYIVTGNHNVHVMMVSIIDLNIEIRI